MAVKNKYVFGVDKVGKALNKYEKLISQELVDSMASELARDILEEANRNCPYETGELRNSAIAVIHRGRSRDLGTVAYVDGAGAGGGGDVYVDGYTVGVKSHIWVLEIGYTRKRGSFDLASWLHENLQPADTRPDKKSKDYIPDFTWYAIQPGTGPRWLLNATESRIDDWFSRLHSRFRNIIGK